ncbi:MAG: prepilin-type N-terminal cleavage/methylation domain-containing protein [candidate division KSB1 bacterium]|jgi:type IV pilus assembly protein PilE|nr:prepilin-type N-terminal cleavage/methylation domain-containing protein [candidate division KSB1 bacterium]
MGLRTVLKNEDGFSLTELLVVVVIIGILSALAIPKFTNVTTRAKTTEAKLMLRQVYNLQMGYYLENDMYSSDLVSLGFMQERLKTEGGQARYSIRIEKADATLFLASATSVVDYDKDGSFNVWTIDNEGLLTESVAD